MNVVEYYNYNPPCANATKYMGHNTDAHGCIPSAGFTWNDKSKSCCKYDCVNPVTPNKDGPQPRSMRPGGDVDSNGCRPTSGFFYNADAGKCCRAHCVAKNN